MSTLTMAELAGTDLGTEVVAYDDTAAILYNVSVGAKAGDLGLVWERELTVLPTYACALGLWAVEAAGRLGAYDPATSLHASQRLVMHKPLPTAGEIAMSGRVIEVLDKGKASVVKIEVSSDYFDATYSIFLPGVGDWGGDRGPSSPRVEAPTYSERSEYETSENLAVLYRLTGDRHPIHVDPALAAQGGFDRPILHGLCTLGIAAREIAGQVGMDPGSLVELDVSLSAPVLPGQTLTIESVEENGQVRFDTKVEDTVVLARGVARFAEE